MENGASKKINIGFHGTLLNRLDYMKRICPNHILASNMFNNSETLSGRLTYQERSIPGHDFLYRAGGIGWLKENFYRLLNVFDPANETTSASIKEVAIYFGLTPLIHYYYLRNGMTANRQKSYNFFMNEGSVSKKVKDAVEFIYNFKNGDKECHQQDNLPLLEATYIVLNFVGKSFAETGAKATEKQQNTIEDEDSALISTLIGRQASIASVKSYFSANTFVEALTMIKTNAAAFSNVTPDEYFETLAFLIKNPDVNEVKRVYFFEQGDLRANDNIDFLPKSFSSLVYSWEKGIATYVQRLTDLYLNSSNLTENDLMLAKVLVSVSFKKYLELRNEGLSLEYLDSKLGFTNGFSLEDRYFHCLELLADLGESAINEINSKI